MADILVNPQEQIDQEQGHEAPQAGALQAPQVGALQAPQPVQPQLALRQPMNNSRHDLQGHQATGRGQRAKFRSRIGNLNPEYSQDEDERGFQRAFVMSWQSKYQKKIDDLSASRDDEKEQAAQIRNELPEPFLQSTESLMEAYQFLLQQSKECQIRVQTAIEKMHGLQNQWKRNPYVRNRMTSTDAANEIEAETKKRSDISSKLESSQAALALAKANRESYEGSAEVFAGAKRWYYERKIASAEADVKEYKLQYQKQNQKVKRLEAQKEYMKHLRTAYRQERSEREHAQELHEEYERLITAFCDMYASSFAVNLSDNLTQEEREENEKKQKYLKAYGLRRQAEIDQSEINENTKNRDAIEAKVQRAGVLNMARTGYQETIRAIILDGEMYYDSTQLDAEVRRRIERAQQNEQIEQEQPIEQNVQEEQNAQIEQAEQNAQADQNAQIEQDAQADQHVQEEQRNQMDRAVQSKYMEGLVERDEEKILLEEESVINQLGHLDVFQYINSDNLMEYMDYDEKRADFIFQAQANAGQEQAGQQPADPEAARRQLIAQLEKYGLTDDILMQLEGGWENVKDGIGDGSVWFAKLIGTIIKDGILDFTGVGGIMDFGRQNNEGATTDAEKGLGNGLASVAQVAATLLNVEGLGLLQKMKDVQLATTVSNVDTVKLLGIELLGAADPSLILGIGTLIGMIQNVMKISDNKEAGRNISEYGRMMKENGLNRFGRIMDNAVAEKKIKQTEGYTDAAGLVLMLGLTLTGIAGMAVTLGIVGIKALIKKIGASRIRSETSEEIIKSPAILGGLSYDRQLISEEHFKVLFHEATGVNEPSMLGDVIKVVDGIDLHRAARRSALIPDAEVDGAMRQLGFTEPEKYPNIKLDSIYKKIGMTDKNWRQVLRNAIEIKGVDYNTGWTKFVKGITGNADYYADQKIDSRRDIMQKRRQEILAKRSMQNAV